MEMHGYPLYTVVTKRLRVVRALAQHHASSRVLRCAHFCLFGCVPPPPFSIPFGVGEGETDKTDLLRRQLCYQLLSVHSTPWMPHSLLELLCPFIFHIFPIFRASPSFSLLPLLLSFYSSFCGHLLLYAHFSLCTTSQCVHSLPMPFTITISDYH